MINDNQPNGASPVNDSPDDINSPDDSIDVPVNDGAEGSEGDKSAENTDESPKEKSPDKKVSILSKIFNIKSLSIWLPVTIIALVFIVVMYYTIFPSKGYFHADCTDTLVWAAASAESGKIFDPDCTYACLLPFGGSLLMIPFYGIFGFSMTTHIIGMSLFVVIFSAALLFMLRQMKWSLPWTAVMFSAIMLTLSVSTKLREIFWGHVIYYSLGVLFIFVGLGIYFKICNAYEDNANSVRILTKRRKILLFTLLFVWFFLCATNKIMSITIFSAPAIGAMFLERFLDTKSKADENKFYGFAIILALAATLLGFIASTIAAGDIKASYADAYSTYANPDLWVENYQKFFGFWLTLLGVSIREGDPLMSGDSVMNIIKIAAALMLLVIPFIGTCFYTKIKDRFTRIILLLHWLVFALIMLGFVFGLLSAANWRLSPIACTAIMSTVAFCKWIFDNTEIKRLGVLLIIPQLCVGTIAANEIRQMPYNYGQDEGLYELADFIEDQGLTFGYATFWNANSVTVISEDKVKVRSINDINEYGISKYAYQTRKQWFEPDPDQDYFFLLLTDYEYETLQTFDNPVLLMPHDTLDFKDFTILVFEENIL